MEEKPATATVTAVENSLLLVVSLDNLRAKLNSDLRFAAHWYKALAVLSSHRLRLRVLLLSQQLNAAEAAAAQDSYEWSEIRQWTARLKTLLHEIDREATQANTLANDRKLELDASFQAYCRMLDLEIGEKSQKAEHVRAEIGAWIQVELRPYLLAAESAETGLPRL